MPILPKYYVDVHTLHGEPRAYTCTANFVFQDEEGNRYIGTAGHCAPLSWEEPFETWPYPSGLVAHDIDGESIGRFVYGSYQLGASVLQPLPGIDREWISDFSLIRLDEDVPGNALLVRLAPEMRLAEERLGVTLTLETGPLETL